MARGIIAGMASGVIVSGLGLATASLMLPPPTQVGLVLPTVPETDPDPATDPAPPQAQRPGQGATAASGPAEGVPLPAGSEFARPGAEAVPTLPGETPAPAGVEAVPRAPMTEAQTEAEIAALDDPVTAPPPRPETGTDSPTALVPQQTPDVALERLPSGAPTMPVPPPGEAVAPDLPPAEAVPGPGQEITLMPDGALVPVSPGLPRVISPGLEAGANSGFADAAGTKVNRLPQIGGAPQAAPATDEALPDPAPALPPEAEADRPAIEKYAAAFNAAPDKPWFTVVLVDPGPAAGGLDRATIKALGPWLTLALDPAAPDVTEAAAEYRAAGFEVGILADDLPPGAAPKDVEVALAAWRAAVPEALALVEPPKPVLQGASRLAEQAREALAAEGMVYVTQAVGMEAMSRGVTDDAGLQATIWRVLDARRDKAPVIARTLSRAAFEANRDGSVVVMLSAWPESIAGLQEWVFEEAAALNLAPLSATVQAMRQP
ncbi:divergent polysaccharide deacetylase family protein [Rhodobacter sp. TJ_12]|uniref:divergent polysaccharide deacetylase family protein n=1 Tax=Rhodobacter sp. TJ_12 TaxID=2029399 RepID=UPI001CBDB67D|nr:divergent polysaccharide deacetylase family protein [Rhodobacter sp. TJ_12]